MNGIITKRSTIKIVFVVLLFLIAENDAAEERTVLDAFTGILRAFKLFSFSNFRNNENRRNFRTLTERHKLQDEVSQNTPFPCDPSVPYRSKIVPTSVHKLRAGDIDVIGALGDSLTAGYGLAATNALEVNIEARGKSFSIGGEGTWRSYLTLPNILKVFNPNLIGYSLRSSASIERESQFNVAEGGAISKNMPYMTKVLLTRIVKDKRINLNKDWKMVTLMIGDNDFCSEICYNGNLETSLQRHKQDLLTVLRLLRDNLPRTIVNVIPPPHLEILTLMRDKPLTCSISHSISCPCMIGLTHQKHLPIYFDFMRKWQLQDIEICNSPEFDLEDFTVIPHHFTLNYTFPRISTDKLDYSFLSEDCFHFSQKGAARFANDLWNSIISPFGKKSTDGADVFSKFNCPTKTNPYIFTRRNS